MSKVSRAVFQRQAEEVKRLKADIRLLVMDGMSAKGILCRGRYKDGFEKAEAFGKALKDHIICDIKANPEKYPAFMVEKANETL